MTQFRQILVATDFGEPSQRAAELGLVIARRFGAGFTLVHTCQLLVHTYEGLYPSADIIDRITDAARQQLNTALAGARQTIPEASALLHFGPAWDRILAAIQETHADLLLLGTHGRTGVARVLLGSVAERVVRLSPVPTIVVP
jgi:nucleotide-binding universal stress UspA family protein